MDSSKVFIPTQATVFAFKSIFGETTVPLRPGLQYLVGKNGAGKSALLQAIGLLDEQQPLPATWPPKFLSLDKQRTLQQNSDTVIVEVAFDCSLPLFKGLDQPPPKDIKSVTVAIQADGKRAYTTNKGALPKTNQGLLGSWVKAFNALFKAGDSIARNASLSEPLRSSARALAYKNKQGRETVSRQQAEPLAAALDSEGLASEAADIRSKAALFVEIDGKYQSPPEWTVVLAQYVPKVTFVPSRYELPDAFDVAQAYAATDGPLLSAHKLLQLAGLPIGTLDGLDELTLQQAIHGANETLQSTFGNKWTQEPLSIRLSTQDGKRVVVALREGTGAFVAPSESGEGLKWFLPFFVNLQVDVGSEWHDAIILVDDPGVYLHLDAQRGVRDMLEQLANSNCVVVVTHSPSLLSLADTSRIHVVEKLPARRSGAIGTVVRTSKASGWSDRAVVRAAMGMRVGDTLFGNSLTFIVEGQSDRIYLEAATRAASLAGDIKVPADEIGIISANGADNIEFYATWCESEQRKFVVVLDDDSKGRGVQKRLDSLGLSSQTLLTSDFVREGAPKDNCIEDVLDCDIFDAACVNCYARSEEEHARMTAAASLQEASAMNVTRATKYLGRSQLDKTGIAAQIAGMLGGTTAVDELESWVRLKELANKAVEMAKSYKPTAKLQR